MIFKCFFSKCPYSLSTTRGVPPGKQIIAGYISFCIAPIKITTLSIVLAISQQIRFCTTSDQPLLFLRFSIFAEICLII
ncbi:hypothetical protein T12_887 [Trichinella patagoniensis]|uniref:Uncharacterized protein n=1 Tax=Trichinella patagoniensis TaxID=990121 RepID=A0A0V0ZUP4_9BILA|nr:hypothetical protein T12_887 [Trichinella patagoniensis]